MRDRLTEIPGVRYNFSQPIKDNVEEAVAGVRGKVVLKVFGTDIEGRCAMRWSRRACGSPACRASSTSACTATRRVPQLQMRARPRRAGARRHRRWRRANDFIGTALAGKVTTTVWEGERPVPVRLMLPFRGARQRAGDRRSSPVPRPGGGSVPLRADRADRHRQRRGQHLPRVEQPLSRAQVQRRGARHGLGGERRHRRGRRQASSCPTATTSSGAASSRTSSAPSARLRDHRPARARGGAVRCSTARCNPGARRAPSCSPRRSR